MKTTSLPQAAIGNSAIRETEDQSAAGFIELFLMATEQVSDLLALRDLDLGQEYTYGELRSRAEAFCAQLKRLDLDAGSRIVLALGNGIHFLSCYLGSIGAGFVPMLLNPFLSGYETQRVLEEVRPGALVGDAEYLSSRAKGLAALNIRFLFCVGPEGGSLVGLRALPLAEAGSGVHALAIPDQEQIVTIQCTYKGTGKPLLVGHRYDAINAAIRGMYEKLHPMARGARVLVALPLTGVFGLSTLFLMPIAKQASLVMCSQPLKPNFLELLNKEKIELVCLIPEYYAVVADQLKKSPYKGVGLSPTLMMYSGGCYLSSELALELDRLLPRHRVLQGYGLTEALPVIAQHVRDAALPGSLGTAFEGILVEILDAEGRHCPPGVVGEIVVSGPTVALGYLNDADMSAQIFTAQGLHTGDLGCFSVDGQNILFFGQRNKITKINSQMVDYVEIESLVKRLPGVAEARVIAQRGARGRRSLRLEVIVQDEKLRDGKAITRMLREMLSSHKIPRAVVCHGPRSGLRS